MIALEPIGVVRSSLLLRKDAPRSARDGAPEASLEIDATVIRGVLLPATMKLLGERNWYLPRWLEWLPRAGEERPTRRGSRHREEAVGEAGA